jgi:acyl-coenzyme A synthetase/AMP-(fatty) acid ligase
VIIWEALLALVSGARLEIPVGMDRVPGPQLVEWLSREKISVLACTPTMLAALPEVNLPALRLIVLGGEPVDPVRHRFWIERHQVANAYGPTEATIATHVCPRISVNGPAPIGHPVPGVMGYLLDDELQPVADGEIGNLYVGGVGLAVGYDGLPELTADAFPTLSLDGRPQRVYQTGDRAYRRGDGQLVFVGRADRQLNLGGYRLEPGEVEAAATAHPGVSAAVALADGEPGRQVLELHAAVPAGDVTTSQLRQHLAKVLPAQAVPARIRLWSQLPLTDSGKPDLPALTRREPVAVSSTTASTGLPEQVVLWWTEATGSPPTEGADFFDSGGHSLRAVRLLHQINEAYGCRITINAFVADPTPDHLARALAEVVPR